MYEVFEHTADVGLRVRAPSLDELFGDAAQGLFTLIVANPADIEPCVKHTLNIPGRPGEYDYLLFDWLNELLFLFDTQQLLFSTFEAHVKTDHLEATAAGEPFDPARHRLEHEVKAVTYHGLKVARDRDEWLAEVILDI